VGSRVLVAVCFAVAACLSACAVQPVAGPALRGREREAILPFPAKTPTASPSPLLYVTDSGAQSVFVYPVDAAGDATPMATIAGSDTGLSSPIAIGFDSARRIYVLNAASVTVFGPGAHGDALPKYTIAGAVTGLSEPAGMAVAQSGVAFVTNDGGGGEGYITVYAAGANGDRAPLRTIYDVDAELFVPAGIALHDHRLYVADQGDESIDEFASSDNGDVGPTNVIDGLSNPSGVAVDPNGLIYVAEGDEVLIFAAKATGYATPLRTIVGAKTMLEGAAGLAVGAAIGVANENGASVTSYRLRANGDASPLRTLEGADTGFVTPTAVGFL
jgi:hypothetical protein